MRPDALPKSTTINLSKTVGGRSGNRTEDAFVGLPKISLGENEGQVTAVTTTTTPPPVDARTQAFLDLVARNAMRCTTAALQPVTVTTLERKVVLIASIHGSHQFEADLKGFFLSQTGHSDRILDEGVMQAGFCRAGVRNIDDPAASAKLRETVKDVVDEVRKVLAILVQTGIEAPAWKQINDNFLQRIQAGEAYTVCLCQMWADMLERLPSWADKPPAIVEPALGVIRGAIRFMNKAIDATSAARNKHMGDAIKEEQAGLRARGVGTVFAPLGMAHTEAVRDRFAEDADVILVEPQDPGVTRDELRS